MEAAQARVEPGQDVAERLARAYRPLIVQTAGPRGRVAYNPRPMSNRSGREPLSRAEARRRSRLLERGEALPDEEEAADDEATGKGQAARGGMFRTLFPDAPPLPNRPDPLAGFNYDGPLRSVVAALYLLANHPRAWLLPAIPWACAQTLTLLMQTNGAVQIVTVMVSVFSLIAAGWIGWQKPWLFGLAATIAGTLVQGIFFALLPPPAGVTPDPLAAFLQIVAVQIAQLQWILGAFIGWYGGYLRRRMASTSPQAARRRRR